mgnify:CR=1 FL=1|jgi:hypothetical protein
MDGSILEMIAEHAANERLDDIIQNDEGYMAIQEEVDENEEKLDGLSLSQEQKLAVDTLTASYIAKGIRYARVAYRQGFKDCAAFLKEIGAI